MNRETLDDTCERGILLLVLGILLFAPLAMGAVGTWEFLVVQTLTLGVMLLWGLRLWISPKPQLLWPPVCWVVLAFALYAIGRYWTADIEYVARLEMIQVLVYGFLFFALVNNLYRQESAQVISFTVIFLAMAISGWAVFQFLTRSNLVWGHVSPYPGRASGSYISPDDLAGFLEMLLPLALASILAGRMKALMRVLLGYALLVMLAGMAVTFSRGGWAAATAALVALLAAFAFQRRQRLPALALLIVLIGGGLFFVRNYLGQTVTYLQRIEQTEKTGVPDFAVRRGMWVAALDMWRDHLWWGVGPGLYDSRFPQYRPQDIQKHPGHAHNDYLNLLADWGAVGGGIVLAGMAIFGAGWIKTWRRVRKSETDLGSGLSQRLAFFLGASAGLLALAIHSFVDFNLHIPANAILGVTLLALLSSNLRFATDDCWHSARTPARVLVTLVLAGGLAYLGWQTWRRGDEYLRLQRAQRPGLTALTRAALLQKAFAVEPMNPQTAYDLGEAWRLQSFQGGPDYAEQAQTALRWYKRAARLDPFDAYSYMRQGMCLDWLGRHQQAQPLFDRAVTLDPNGYYTAFNMGWHYAQAGDDAAARTWLQRSVRLDENQQSPVAGPYLQLVEHKLIDQAAGPGRRPGFGD
ncbi:MAG: O-antigen ligase family protein [Verrucomicrobiota bacterium]|nr:O-antigen ligase family protein [Verrucomicrobiota bacterium]